MYHPAKLIRHASIYLLLIACLSIRLRADCKPIQPDQSVSSTAFPLLPARANTVEPVQMTMYQFDNKPLNGREPLLLVHGLNAELWPGLRWTKTAKRLASSPEFSQKYKIYFVRYDSLTHLDKPVAQLQAKIAELYALNGQKPITILALSMGGNVVYQSMLKAETDKQVRLFMAMATPFHGSPLFSEDWMLYGNYKNYLSPLNRIDRSLGYKYYFSSRTNLLTDLPWDNCDLSVPDIGQFASLLPFGPRGNLTAARTVNPNLVSINQKDFDKSKIIAYSGFLSNVYQLPHRNIVIANTLLLPYHFMTITVPAHLGREHAVLRMLNDQMSKLPTTETAAKNAHSKYVYSLNDGIAPVASALFLPNHYCNKMAIARESDLVQIKPFIDVGVARIFRNTDHLTFIDGYKPFLKPSAMRDELNPQMGDRDIFSWILFDLDCTHLAMQQSSTLTKYN